MHPVATINFDGNRHFFRSLKLIYREIFEWNPNFQIDNFQGSKGKFQKSMTQTCYHLVSSTTVGVTGKETVRMNTTGYKDMPVTVGMTAKAQCDKIKAFFGLNKNPGRMSSTAKGVSGKEYGSVHIEWDR